MPQKPDEKHTSCEAFFVTPVSVVQPVTKDPELTETPLPFWASYRHTVLHS